MQSPLYRYGHGSSGTRYPHVPYTGQKPARIDHKNPDNTTDIEELEKRIVSLNKEEYEQQKK